MYGFTSRRWLLGCLLVAVGSGGAPATALADAGYGPVGPFGAVVPVGAEDVGPPVATFGLDGTLLVAWAGLGHFVGSPPSGQEGVTIAERRPGELTPTLAVRLTPPGDGTNRSSVAVDVGDDGTRAVAWVDQPDRGTGVVRLALARRGEGFAEPESVPLPSSPGATDAPVGRRGPVTVTVAPDGRAVIGLTQEASDTVAGGAIAVIRETSGAYGSPQTLNTSSFQQPVTVRATGGGEVLALHVATPADNASPRRVLVSRLAPGATGFGPPEEITVPGGAMVSGEDALLASNSSGQAVVSFAAAANSQVLFPDRVVASLRRPDGSFPAATTVLTGEGLLRRPAIAIGAAGDAYVVATGSRLIGAFSPRGGSGFGAPDPAAESRGSNTPLSVGRRRDRRCRRDPGRRERPLDRQPAGLHTARRRPALSGPVLGQPAQKPLLVARPGHRRLRQRRPRVDRLRPQRPRAVRPVLLRDAPAAAVGRSSLRDQRPGAALRARFGERRGPPHRTREPQPGPYSSRRPVRRPPAGRAATSRAACASASRAESARTPHRPPGRQRRGPAALQAALGDAAPPVGH